MEVVIQIIHVGHSSSLLNDTFNILVLKIHVANEPALRYFVFYLLLVLEWLTRIHVKAVDFLHFSSGLAHADLVDLAAETLASRREVLEKVAGEDNLAIIGVAELVNAEDNLCVLAQIKRVNLELRPNGAFNGSAHVQAEREADVVFVCKAILDARVL